LDIIFIKTTSSGYGIDANGVRYLTLQKGHGGTVGAGTMKVALLNLGQSADWTPEGGYVPNNDAGDLGDFYQWGRVADGHQNTVWSKPTTGTSRANTIEPVGATPERTSATVAHSLLTYDANGQIPATETSYYGKFIKGYAYWGSFDDSLWGNSSVTGSALSSLDFGWTYPSNNPCPSGWRVPSLYNIGNLYRGSDTPTSDTSTPYDVSNAANNNTWEWRAGSNNSSPYAIGGVILTNAAGEKLFLPALGYRYYSDGALYDAGTYGRCWSSTYNHTSSMYELYFDSSRVTVGNTNTSKADGFSVRCVAEEEEEHNEDCSGVSAPEISSSSPFPACSVGESVTFTAAPAGDYKWQISSDNGGTWTDVSGTGASNNILFPTVGNYLVHASAAGCNEKVSNALQVQALTSINPLNMDALKIMTLNNVMYSYQYAKLVGYTASGTVLGYQWYMKFAGYNVQGGNIPSTPPAVNETDDIIVGATQSSYTFDPYSDAKYQGAGTYYFYCKAFGKNGSTDVVSSDVILVRVDDLYDASRSNLLITKAQWQIDSAATTSPYGPIYFIPVLYGSANASLKIAHANLGSAKTRDSGELGNLYQWARDEDGHERRQYNGRYSNWANLTDTTTFVSPRYLNTTVVYGQATGEAYGKFMYGSTDRWTLTEYISGWGIGNNGSTDPCTSCNSAWNIPSGGAETGDKTSDWVKLTIGTYGTPTWSNNTVSGRTNQNTVLYRYPWGSRYGTTTYGSMTIASVNAFDTGKNYVAILPASGVNSFGGGLINVGWYGFYWSSTYYNLSGAYNMRFNNNNVVNSEPYKAYGGSVRCATVF
jgi:uncharacterized protein (TIGR02145 family)